MFGMRSFGRKTTPVPIDACLWLFLASKLIWMGAHLPNPRLTCACVCGSSFVLSGHCVTGHCSSFGSLCRPFALVLARSLCRVANQRRWAWTAATRHGGPVACPGGPKVEGTGVQAAWPTRRTGSITSAKYSAGGPRPSRGPAISARSNTA